MAVNYLKASGNIFVAGLALLLGFQTRLLGQSNENSEQKKLFYLSFDEGFKANGTTAPVNSDQLPELRDGIKSKAAFMDNGKFLKYAQANYLNTLKGSVSLWVKNPSGTDKNARSGGKKHLFQMEVNEAARSFIDLGILPDLAVFLQTGKDKYGTFSSSVPFPDLNEKDKWHQVVFTWDYSRGIKIYLNGRLIFNKLVPKAEKPQFDAFLSLIHI